MNLTQYTHLLELISKSLITTNQHAITRLFTFTQNLVQFQSKIAVNYHTLTLEAYSGHEDTNLNESTEVSTYIAGELRKIDAEHPCARSILLPEKSSRNFSITSYSPIAYPPGDDLELDSRYKFSVRAFENDSIIYRISFSSIDENPIDESTLLANILVPMLKEVVSELLGISDQETPPQLTQKEHEVLRWIMEGKSNWDIAQILALSERTIKFHLHNIYQKLGVHTRAHAVAMAIKFGLR